MPNKDWYWERRFKTTVKEGELDLSDAQTSAIRDNENIDDATALRYETDWIDQLYGTEGREWVREQAPKAADLSRGVLGENPDEIRYDIDEFESSPSTWGLDIKRDWTDKEDLKVGSDEHFEWQTRGKVAWDKYYDDNAYQKAFQDYRDERTSGSADSYSNLKDYLLANDQDDDAEVSDREKVNFLNYAKTHTAEEEDDGGLPDTWDNKYVDQFDPETAEPYKPTYLDVPDLWGQAEFEPVETPIEVTKPQGLPNLASIKRIKTERGGIPLSWGKIKSAPTSKFKAGGSGGD